MRILVGFIIGLATSLTIWAADAQVYRTGETLTASGYNNTLVRLKALECRAHGAAERDQLIEKRIDLLEKKMHHVVEILKLRGE